MTSSALERGQPRLAPLRRIRGVLVRLMALGLRLKLGKVMTPLRVIYARMPALALPHLGLYRVAGAKLSLDPLLVHLVQVRVSMANGCSFCTDLHQAMALHDRRAQAVLDALFDARADAGLDAAQRAALAYVDEICRTGRASDERFELLRACFDERQIVELTWLCAFTTYLNRLATPLGIGSDGFCTLARASARRA